MRTLIGSRAKHRFRPVGTMNLKGLSEPVNAFELDWGAAETRTGYTPSMLSSSMS